MTKTRHWGFCKVWVETISAKSYVNGFARNNPDKSFYPNDGFNYIFVYGWAGDPTKCRNFSICPIKSHHIMPGISNNCDLQKINILEKKASKNGKNFSTSGSAEISSDENAFGHYIQLQVNAERWGCFYPEKGRRVCGWAQISATGNYSPAVSKPSIDVNLNQEYLDDHDGYRSGNSDGTYYVWDAVSLVHNPVYKWKNDRVGTLSVKVTKVYDLKLEKEFQCERILCDHTLSHNGFQPLSRQYEYGSGLTLYNATHMDEIRKHLITYKVELYNLGKLIHKSENHTSPLVVVYDPVYRVYPYIVLKDEYWWSWGNRQGVALNYAGSLGEGKDDLPGIHENRRSKINRHEYVGYAFNPILKKYLNETFSWDQANSIVIDPEKKCNDVKIDPLSFQTKDASAMFVRSGYGKIAFTYPILKTMLEKRYINATIDNTLQTVNFAGYKIKNLTNYVYQYPDVKFSNPVRILTYHSDGIRTELPLSITMVPDPTKNTQYVQNYTCQKTFHDTKRYEFSNIVVDDMYDMTNKANGTGFLDMKTKLTSLWFPEFYSVLSANPLDLPISDGYKALSPYKITITAGQESRTIHRVVSFLSPFTHVINLDPDNTLNITRHSGFVRINPDETFGEIVKVSINGKILEADCTNGCTTISTNQDLHIESWNIWGGRAFAYVEKPETGSKTEINWNMTLVAMAALAIGIILWKFSAQMLEYLKMKNQP